MKKRPLYDIKEFPYYLRDAYATEVSLKTSSSVTSLNHQSNAYLLNPIHKPIVILYATPKAT